MSPEGYRYYCLDTAGPLRDARSSEATGDEHAVAQISLKHPDSRIQISRGRGDLSDAPPGIGASCQTPSPAASRNTRR